MSRKMKSCKTCGEKIAKSAKRCPHCGAKQGGGVGKVIGTVVLVLLVLWLFGSILGSGDDKPKRVNQDPADSGDTAPAASTEPQAEPEQTTFGVGEAVSLNDIVVTLVDVSESSGGNYMEAPEGKVFVICEFEIENNSQKDITVSSLLSFEAYIDDYSTNLDLTATVSADKKQLDGSVAAGKKMNGIVGYAADAGWSDIEIRFTPDFWSGKEIIFTASK